MKEKQQSEFGIMISSLISSLILEGKIFLSPLRYKWHFSTTFTLESKISSEYGISLKSNPRTYKVSWHPLSGEETTPLAIETPEGSLIPVAPVGSLKTYLDFIEADYRAYLNVVR